MVQLHVGALLRKELTWLPSHRDLMHCITLEIFTEIWLPYKARFRGTRRLLAEKQPRAVINRNSRCRSAATEKQRLVQRYSRTL